MDLLEAYGIDVMLVIDNPLLPIGRMRRYHAGMAWILIDTQEYLYFQQM